MNANTPNDAIDHNIDRALAGLRDARPRSGLNSRILASLEHRATTPQLARPYFPAHIALWAATSAAILAISSLVILHHQTNSFAGSRTKPVILSEAHSAQPKDPEIARVPANSKPFSTPNLTIDSPQTPVEPTRRVTHLATATMPVACAQLGCPTHDDSAVVMSGVTTVADSDAQALADWHAPSHPAPPLPLTPEEKLFRRMLQYRNATQLAELDPMVRAKENADETTAFKAFFPDPPPLKQPLGDTE